LEPGLLARCGAWAGAACLGLLVGTALAALRQPQDPDAVVAMIRPDRIAEAPAGYLPPVPDLRIPERSLPAQPTFVPAAWAPGEACYFWPARARVGYQLIQLRHSQF
jgi:hypothetical protein